MAIKKLKVFHSYGAFYNLEAGERRLLASEFFRGSSLWIFCYIILESGEGRRKARDEETRGGVIGYVSNWLGDLTRDLCVVLKKRLRE